MRCPKCKTELLKDKDQEFETLLDHVFNPNANRHPLRTTFVCPNKCSNGFYDNWGDYYGDEKSRKYWQALDSGARNSEIHIKVTHPTIFMKTKLSRYLQEVNEIKIDEEKDIPSTYKLWYYFMRAKRKHLWTILTLSIPLSLGIQSYDFEKDQKRITIIRKRISRWRDAI